MLPPMLDLFGEVPVLESEMLDWVTAVAPAYLSTERSYQSYIKAYDVPAKIRRAKLCGDFDHVIAKPLSVYHARLALASVL